MPNASAARGSTAWRGSGRCRVRRIRSSMSRSTYLLIAFAPPAASVPPITTAAISQSDGIPRCAEHHRRHGGDQQQLDDPRLGQRDVGAERVHRPGRRMRSCGPPRHLGRTQATGGQQQPDRCAPQRGADGQVRHDEQGGQPRHHVQPRRARSGHDHERSQPRARCAGSGASVERRTAIARPRHQPGNHHAHAPDAPRGPPARGRRSAGTSAPFISGTSPKARPACWPVTHEPSSIWAKIATAVIATSRVRPGRACAAGIGPWLARSAMKMPPRRR